MGGNGWMDGWDCGHCYCMWKIRGGSQLSSVPLCYSLCVVLYTTVSNVVEGCCRQCLPGIRCPPSFPSSFPPSWSACIPRYRSPILRLLFARFAPLPRSLDMNRVTYRRSNRQDFRTDSSDLWEGGRIGSLPYWRCRSSCVCVCLLISGLQSGVTS